MRYFLTIVLSFFRSEKYQNRLKTSSIQRYVSSRDLPINDISPPTFMNSLICAILTKCESFIMIVIVTFSMNDSAPLLNGPFGLILHWNGVSFGAHVVLYKTTY